MKTYYLRFTEADFSVSGNLWRTDVIDLYYNDQFKNYSAKKANYGTDLLGDGTYTGINRLSEFSSEIGFVEDGRFIDTSGRIDLITWNINFSSSFVAEADIITYLNIYTTPDATSTPYYLHATPDLVSDWTITGNIVPGFPAFVINSNRYVFFELSLNSEADLSSLQFEFIISVDIDPPVVNAYFSGTRSLLNRFPEWMALREYDPSDPLGATPATPTSVGATLLNAAAGEWITDLLSKIQYQQYQLYIQTVDITQKAWVYKSGNIPDNVYQISGNGTQLTRASSIEEFSETSEDEDVVFWNQKTNEIYSNKTYASFLVNGVEVDQSPYQVWNSVDDIGVTVDLFRLYLEDNDSFKKRILDVYRNPLGVNQEAFQLALRRELNLWRYWGATPDSDYFGATPSIQEISDLEKNGLYFTPAGLPTDLFKVLVKDLAQKYPLTWGYFLWDRAYWDPDGLYHQGFSQVPEQLDATPLDPQYTDSGVGDLNDLYLFKPKAFSGKKNINARLKIRGRHRTTRTEYIPLSFDVKVYGTGVESKYTNPDITGNFTIELLTNEATPKTYYCNVTLSTQNNTTYYSSGSSGGWAELEWTTPDGYTDIEFIFKDKATDEEHDGQIALSTVSTITIKGGHFDGALATPAYIDVPTTSEYRLWFISTPGTFMGSGGASTLSLTSFNYAVTSPTLILSSMKLSYFYATPNMYIAATPNTWVSQEYIYRITINGALPNMTQQDYTLTLPSIVWPSSVTSRQYVVELLTTDGSTYGAFSDALASTPIFIPYSYLYVNGDNTWSIDNNSKAFSSNTTSITFSSGTGSIYPVTNAGVWELFEASQVTDLITGTVDQNGPVLNGISSANNNTNFLLTEKDLSRTNFSIANTTDYIVTWIGVDAVDDDEVLVWVETNVVKPAVSDLGENAFQAVYPDRYVEETLDGAEYTFGKIKIYAKIKPGVNDKWHPKIHSGWFRDDDKDYYLYASPNTEHATAGTLTLKTLNRQSAPIIVTAYSGGQPIHELSQVAFFNAEATPYTQSISNDQIVYGNGTTILYAAFENLYDISVHDLTINEPVTLSSSTTATNEIYTTAKTDRDHRYKLTYTQKYSFYVDNDFEDSDGVKRTKLVFDKHPSQISADYYRVDYETSAFDPTTPIDIPLNTFYTSFDEGFIYIDHDVRPVSQVEMKISPSNITADGLDYAVVTVRSIDSNGNPKPYETFSLYTNFGTLSKSQVTTDKEGFASVILQSHEWDWEAISQAGTPSTPALAAAEPGTAIQGIVYADGTVDGFVRFGITPLAEPANKLMAVMDSDHIAADGNSGTYIFGIVEDSEHNPVPYAVVYWNKARTLYELFQNRSFMNSAATPGAYNLKGYVFADVNGRFKIGPFKSLTMPGYWLVSAETGSSSPSMTPNANTIVGDIVYWYEYPNVTNIIDEVSQTVNASVQASTPTWSIPPISYGSAFPTSYDEQDIWPGYEMATINWSPPKWYAIDKYKQYQMGILGDDYFVTGATPRYPEYKEL